MGDLEDLVTQNIVPTKTETEILCPAELLESEKRVSLAEIERVCSLLLQELDSIDPREVPYRLAQLQVYRSRAARGNLLRSANALSGSVYAARYAAFARAEDLEEIRSWTRAMSDSLAEEREREEQERTLSDFISQIDYLRKFFTDDLCEELAAITGVTKASAKRWESGGNTSWRNMQKISLLAKIFYNLERKHGHSPEKALWWYKTAVFSGRTPAEIFRHYKYAYAAPYQEIGRDLGIRT